MTIETKVKHGLEGSDHNDPLLEGEDLTHTIAHQTVIMYLILVLKRLFAGQDVGVVNDVSVKFSPRADKYEETYKSPDITVINGVVVSEDNPMATYEIGPGKPPPRLTFEIASEGTWPIDLDKKPYIYAEMGISEYFTYDPNKVWTGEWRKKGQLLGWRLNPLTRQPVAIPFEKGRLWSEQLDSWLGLDKNQRLRLYDAQGRLRLTDEEALVMQLENERRQAATQLKAERRRAATERRKVAAQLEVERQQAATQLEAERQRIAELTAQLEQLKKNSGNLPTGDEK